MNIDLVLKKLFNTNPITGSYCKLFHITLNDAELVYNLRNRKNNNYLKKTNGSLSDQKKYLINYFDSFNKYEQIYYKIFDIKSKRYTGVFRITELLNEENYNWESAVFDEDSNPNCFLDTMLMNYRIGFEYLRKKNCGPWEVDRNYNKMMKIHEILKMAKVVDQNEKYFFVNVNHVDYFKNINTYRKMKFGELGGLF